jgi:flagellar hook-associated protein 3 FlgL
MIQSLTPDSALFLTNLARIQRRIDVAQRQVSSGYRLERASDDPAAVVELLQLQVESDVNLQIQANLDREKSEVDIAARVIDNAVKLVERAAVLGTQASGSLQSAEKRLQILEEVQGIHSQLVAATQTVVNGRFIFSGDRDQTPAYRSNPSLEGGVERLQFSGATREVKEPGGTSFAVSRTAHDIFDDRDASNNPTASNVFVAVQQLATGLQTNAPAVIDSAMQLIRDAAQHLNSELSFYGVTQNRLAAAISTGQQYELQFRTRLSQIRDADVVEAATELSQARLHQEATIAAQANNRPRNLFDYLG